MCSCVQPEGRGGGRVGREGREGKGGSNKRKSEGEMRGEGGEEGRLERV